MKPARWKTKNRGKLKEPDGFGNRDALIEIEPLEPREREPVADLLLGLIIGQVVQGLKDEDFKQQHGNKGGVAALLPLGAAKDGLESRPKFLQRHTGGERS